jgi:hypothetical protein
MRVYDPEAFAERVNIAALVISTRGRTSRSFDTCFEMWDGDAVAVALYRRARKNPKLRFNLFEYVSRQTVVPKAFANRRRKNLTQWARELRAEAKARSDVWFADLEAKRAAETAP